jgi:formate dehydrogenase subunit gamma
MRENPAMRETEASEYVPRFSVWARSQHLAIIALFAVLLLTGMPQKWPYVEASRWIIDRLGGIFVVRWLHRAGGVVFCLLLVAHLAVAVTGVVTRRMQPVMLLSRKDFTDALDNLWYYLGYRESEPLFGRFDYRQKFEYWGLVFGGFIMALSGLILYFPVRVSRLVPADVIPAAKVMHSNEALLAFLIVLIWHMYGAHFNPDSFPMDTSIFTGKIRKDRLRHEHALEYEERYGRP